ncbi:MAG: DUF1479 domain-containing protein [Rhodospirillales bacterium]|nr:DUF1479 domain-containing protein [Rhodospirillales bacterium]
MEPKIRQQIRDVKQTLLTRGADLRSAFATIADAMRREADIILAEQAAGRSVIPELDFADIKAGRVAESQKNQIRQRGAAIIRGVFDAAQAADWNDELGHYIANNDYDKKQEQKAGLDQYFSQLASGRPQIFGIYWSKPQVLARQAPSMAAAKRFLNRLWHVDGPDGDAFDPDFDYAYADRVRRRQPGDTTLGLSPHMDAGSYERWVDPAFQKIYGPVFAGHWQDYDPWQAAHRTETVEYPSPAVCSAFRTFQGWTALTPQGAGDGTLRLVPIAKGIGYMLLRALQDDVADDDLCGAEAGRALCADNQWHPDLLASLVSLPEVAPGDTVWWHPDIIHAVEDEHRGSGYSNVIYIGASPKCHKNRVYVEKQAKAFLSGRSAPDFAAEDYEVDFAGRATSADLTELGRAQMGL